MQANTDLHHHITRGVLPEPDRVFHNPETLDRADDVFDAYAPMRNLLVFCLLLCGEFSTTRLLVGHRDLDTFKRKAHKA